jgi:hypothetical protein
MASTGNTSSHGLRALCPWPCGSWAGAGRAARMSATMAITASATITAPAVSTQGLMAGFT